MPSGGPAGVANPGGPASVGPPGGVMALHHPARPPARERAVSMDTNPRWFEAWRLGGGWITVDRYQCVRFSLDCDDEDHASEDREDWGSRDLFLAPRGRWVLRDRRYDPHAAEYGDSEFTMEAFELAPEVAAGWLLGCAKPLPPELDHFEYDRPSPWVMHVPPVPVRLRTPTAPPEGEAQRPPVVLNGPGGSPSVLGRTMPPLTRARYDVVRALLEAGDDGLTGDQLVEKSSCGGAVTTLKRLARQPGWSEVIRLPGAPGLRYRIRVSDVVRV